MHLASTAARRTVTASLALALALSLSLVACVPGAPSAGSGGGVTTGVPTTVVPTTSPATTTPASGDWTAAMLARINAERSVAGVAPLQLCTRLSNAAQAHSVDQAAHNFMSHTGSNGSSFDQRIEAAGYVHWNALAENVAGGYSTVDAVMTGWMGSSGHRANLVSSSYVHVGVGRSTASNGVAYWTQDFGRGGTC